MKHTAARPWTYEASKVDKRWLVRNEHGRVVLACFAEDLAIATCAAQNTRLQQGPESAISSRRLHQSLVFRLRFRVRAWRHRAQARREIAQMTGHKNRP